MENFIRKTQKKLLNQRKKKNNFIMTCKHFFFNYFFSSIDTRSFYVNLQKKKKIAQHSCYFLLGKLKIVFMADEHLHVNSTAQHIPRSLLDNSVRLTWKLIKEKSATKKIIIREKCKNNRREFLEHEILWNNTFLWFEDFFFIGKMLIFNFLIIFSFFFFSFDGLRMSGYI